MDININISAGIAITIIKFIAVRARKYNIN